MALFLLPAYVRYCRTVEVLPEWFHTGNVLLLLQFCVPSLLTIHLIVDVSRELLLVQIVNDSCQVRPLLLGVVGVAHIERRFLGVGAEATTPLAAITTL